MPPIDAGCDIGPAQCSAPCPALRRWTSGLYSDLEQIVVDDTAKHAQCKAQLEQCQRCLQRLRDKGVIL